MGSSVWGNGFYKGRAVGRTQGGFWGSLGTLAVTVTGGYLFNKYKEKKDAQAAEEAAKKARRAERMKAEYEARKAAAEGPLEADTREDGEGDARPTQSS